jgi:hypothetical protein
LDERTRLHLLGRRVKRWGPLEMSAPN